MNADAEALKKRTKQFAVRVIRLWKLLPRTEEARVLGRQVLRSGTSVAANYRSACRARSKAEFVSRIGIVVEEIDETIFWLELLVDSGIVPNRDLEDLMGEAGQLFAIFVRSQLTAKAASVH